MARSETGTVTTGQRGLLARLVRSRFVAYFVGLEVFFGVIVLLALEFMAPDAFQGIVVGMAISLGVLIAVVGVVAVAAAGLRQYRDQAS